MATTQRLAPKPVAKPVARPAAQAPTPPKKSPARAALKQRTSANKFIGRPQCNIVYGPSGVGKSSFAAFWPNPIFMIDPKEEGIHELVDRNLVPKPVDVLEVTTFQETLDKCYEVASGSTGAETLVLDSLTGFELLCFKSHCDDYFGGDWSSEGFMSFYKGPVNAAKVDWPRLTEALDAVRKSGIHVILLGHSEIKTFKNPDGPDYDTYNIILYKDIWGQTHRWAKAVLFYNYSMNVETRKGGQGKGAQDSKLHKKGKAQEGLDRFIYTEKGSTFEAKNWYGLEPLIEAGTDGQEAFAAYLKAFNKLPAKK